MAPSVNEYRKVEKFYFVPAFLNGEFDSEKLFDQKFKKMRAEGYWASPNN